MDRPRPAGGGLEKNGYSMGMAKKTNIAAELRAAIAKAEAKGKSRYVIAKAAGLSYGQLYRIAEGENLPRLDTAESIAAALGLSLRLCAH